MIAFVSFIVAIKISPDYLASSAGHVLAGRLSDQ